MWRAVLPPSSPAPAAVGICPLLWRAVLPRLQKVSANRARGLDQDCALVPWPLSLLVLSSFVRQFRKGTMSSPARKCAMVRSTSTEVFCT